MRKQFHEASHIVLVGAAVKGEELEGPWTKGTVFVAADGAVGACFGRVDVLCVVTDLDGEPYLSEAVGQSIPLIVHAPTAITSIAGRMRFRTGRNVGVFRLC